MLLSPICSLVMIPTLARMFLPTPRSAGEVRGAPAAAH
jgi:hypothetical protein